MKALIEVLQGAAIMVAAFMLGGLSIAVVAPWAEVVYAWSKAIATVVMP